MEFVVFTILFFLSKMSLILSVSFKKILIVLHAWDTQVQFQLRSFAQCPSPDSSPVSCFSTVKIKASKLFQK